jgi:hypothetical protein
MERVGKSGCGSKLKVVEKGLIVEYIIRFFHMMYCKDNIELMVECQHVESVVQKKQKLHEQKIKI